MYTHAVKRYTLALEMGADRLPVPSLMNIQLGNKRGFALQVMVDVIHCHHTGLVNNTNITVQPGCLYVPDLQLPPTSACRPKQQVTNTV